MYFDSLDYDGERGQLQLILTREEVTSSYLAAYETGKSLEDFFVEVLSEGIRAATAEEEPVERDN